MVESACPAQIAYPGIPHPVPQVGVSEYFFSSCRKLQRIRFYKHFGLLEKFFLYQFALLKDRDHRYAQTGAELPTPSNDLSPDYLDRWIEFQMFRNRGIGEMYRRAGAAARWASCCAEFRLFQIPRRRGSVDLVSDADESSFSPARSVRRRIEETRVQLTFAAG